MSEEKPGAREDRANMPLDAPETAPDPEAAPLQRVAPPPGPRHDWFDLRYVVSTLFLIYGLILTFVGIFFVSPQGSIKDGGIDMNLWLGLLMLLIALCLSGWAFIAESRTAP